MIHREVLYGNEIGAQCADCYHLTDSKKDYLIMIEEKTCIDLKQAAACWEAIDQYNGAREEELWK